MIASTRLVASCALAAIVLNGAAFADGPFKELSYKKALEQAAKEKKIVFIDFYTTWCGPCKMMDASTFKDEKVVKWLSEKAVSLKVDAERNIDLAEKFKVEFYPTLVFVKPDGKEFERMSGYLAPADFLELAEAVEKGESVLDRARRVADASPDDPFKKLALAEALGMRGKTEEAIKLLLWCLDHGVAKDAGFEQTRDGAVVGTLAQLAQSDAETWNDLRKRRDAAEKRIMAGAPEGADVTLFVAVNEYDEDNERTLATYDKLLASDPKGEVTQKLTPILFPVLLEAKRYEDIAKSVDIVAKAEEISRGVNSKPKAAGDADPMATMMLQKSIYELSEYYQTLVGLGRADQAATVADMALKIDDSADTYNALAWAGYLTGKPLRENLTQAEKAWKLDGMKNVGIFDTLVRVMHARGQTAEAIKLCEDYLIKAETDRDKWLIQMCLEEFRAGATN